nr:MAG TPA: hypothetical protein [Caudoviricetes sp.]
MVFFTIFHDFFINHFDISFLYYLEKSLLTIIRY